VIETNELLCGVMSSHNNISHAFVVDNVDITRNIDPKTGHLKKSSDGNNFAPKRMSMTATENAVILYATWLRIVASFSQSKFLSLLGLKQKDDAD
jgi:hypothetical protein